MKIQELFDKIKKDYTVRVLEDENDRKTMVVYKNNEAAVVFCCLFKTEDRENNIFRMDYVKYHDRWANCDYEENFADDEDMEKIYKDIVLCVEHTEFITEDFYNGFDIQDLDIASYVEKTLVCKNTV